MRHLGQHALHVGLPVLVVRVDAQPVDGLQQLGLLVQQLLQRGVLLVRRQTAALDAVGLLKAGRS